MSRFLAFGYLAAAFGGLLLAIGAGLQAWMSADPLSVVAPTAGFAISAALRLSGAIGLIIGLTAIYVRASECAGALGLVAYTLVITNMVMQAGWMWADLFVSPTIAAAAPGVLDGTESGGRLGVGFMIAWLMNASLALLGIAILRARVYRRAVGVALIVMGAITLIPLPFDGPVYEVIIGLAGAIAGYSARQQSAAATSTFAEAYTA